MAQPEARALELDGHRRLTRVGPVEPAAVVQDVLHQRGADEQREELVHDEPVVVPEHEPARLGEDRGGVDEAELLADVVDRLVVEQDEGTVEARDHDVLVAARVRDDRGPLAVARKVFEDPTALDA